MEPGPVAVASAGGKDATLALHRLRALGVRVERSLHVFEGTTGLVRFHGVPPDLLKAQSDALGLAALMGHTHPRDFETVFQALLEELVGLGVSALAFGNIHLADVRDWYEARVCGAGLDHLEPLWGGDPGELVREFLHAGYRTRIVSVDLGRGDGDWLGRELSESLVREMESGGLDPCGEFGEYHTFAFSGPQFRWPVPLEWSGVLEREGHRFLNLLAT